MRLVSDLFPILFMVDLIWSWMGFAPNLFTIYLFFLRLLDSNDACKQYADGNEVEFRVFFPIQILFFVIL
jgi:hypothetical protein